MPSALVKEYKPLIQRTQGDQDAWDPDRQGPGEVEETASFKWISVRGAGGAAEVARRPVALREVRFPALTGVGHGPKGLFCPPVLCYGELA
jgi:hypothetical protein